MFSDGPFSRVFFVQTRYDGVRTYTYRRQREADARSIVTVLPPCVVLHHFNNVFVDTALLRKQEAS